MNETSARGEGTGNLTFFREYSGRLNEWQRRNYTDEKIKNVAMSQFFDVVQSGILNGQTKRISNAVYEVSPQIFSHLKSEGYLDIVTQVKVLKLECK